MILAVFSSCLKTRLMQQVDIHEHQFCFKSGGITHALARVEQFKVQGKTLTLADCTNAYQAIDHNAIMHACNFKESILFLLSTTAPIQTRGAVNTQIHLLQACRLVIVSVHWHSASV
ncbi:Putative_reverse transcriptase/endonuclease [Hexamita inflata]|nr:Putative reverse transcriptase/endonuclease [Hexamita inflata]